MPRLKPDTERARRGNILDAALKCFARGGFHATTVQHICKEARVSPGAFYVYFASKEDLIAGLCERDRAEFAERFSHLAEATDFLKALRDIGEHYFVKENPERQRFVIEMGVEATRNPRIAEIYLGVDRFCSDNFEELFRRLKAKGRIAPSVSIKMLVQAFNILGDGLFWRRAIEPDFNAKAVLPVVIGLVGALLNPVDEAGDQAAAKSSPRKIAPRKIAPRTFDPRKTASAKGKAPGARRTKSPSRKGHVVKRAGSASAKGART